MTALQRWTTRLPALQVAWLVDAEMTPWADGIARQFHRPKKTQAKLTVAFQEVRRSWGQRAARSKSVTGGLPPMGLASSVARWAFND